MAIKLADDQAQSLAMQLIWLEIVFSIAMYLKSEPEHKFIVMSSIDPKFSKYLEEHPLVEYVVCLS